MKRQMKKLITLTLCLSMAFGISACDKKEPSPKETDTAIEGKNDNTENEADTTENDMDHAINSVESGIIDATANDEPALKKVTVTESSDGEAYSTYEFEFREPDSNYSTNLASVNLLLLDNTLFKFSKGGNLSKFSCYDNTNSPMYEVEYEYDTEGNLTKETWSYWGTLGFWNEYEYDEEGKLLNGTQYNADGDLYIQYEYSYDDAGRPIKEVNNFVNDSVTDWFEYEYDDRGNLIKKSLCNDNFVVSWFEYEYNDAGLLSNYSEHENGGSFTRGVECDTNGNLSKATIYYSDPIISTFEFEWEYYD